MPYLMYENDKKRAYTFEISDYVKCYDNITYEKLLYVRFGVQDGAVRMTTSQPLTYIYAGNTLSMSIGDEVTIPTGHDVVLCSASIQNPHIKVRVVKLDDPRTPTPKPEAPPPPPTQELERLIRELHMAPPPSVTQELERRIRELHMLA